MVLAWILIVLFLVIALVTIHFGVHKEGRNVFVATIYIISFVYTIGIGIFFVLFIPKEFLGNKTQAECLVNLGIAALGLLICCYLGWSRISQTRPWLHLLYVSALTSVPMLTYQLNTTTSEAVSSLASAVCFLGLIRYCDKKRDFKAFLMIAIGVGVCVMTKLSAFAICAIMTLLIFIATAIKEDSIKLALPKEFLITLPIYAAALYFAPSLEYEKYVSYLQIGQTYRFNPMVLVFEIMWFTPIFYIVPSIRKYAHRLSLPIVAGWMAVLIVFTYELQAGYDPSLTTWYFGCFMGMHFVPFEGTFALSIVFVAQSLLTENGYDAETNVTTIIDGDIKKFFLRLIYNHFIYLLVLGCCFIFFYGNFPYFLIHFSSGF